MQGETAYLAHGISELIGSTARQCLAVLERLMVNRWEIKSILVTVSLIYLLLYLMSPVVEELMYLFSSNLPASLFTLVWYLILIPVTISLYLININHLKRSKSIWLAILVSAPFAVLSITQDSEFQNLFNDFSSSAQYHKNLSALNWHLSDTVSISNFIQQAESLDPGEFAD